MRCHARPCSFKASRNLLCSSSVHRSLCLVIVYGFLVCKKPLNHSSDNSTKTLLTHFHEKVRNFPIYITITLTLTTTSSPEEYASITGREQLALLQIFPDEEWIQGTPPFIICGDTKTKRGK